MENTIEIKPLKSENIIEASKCLAKNFLREPMNEALNISYEEMLEFSQLAVKEASKSNLSFVAVETKNEKIVGLIINKEFHSPAIPENEAFSKKFHPTFELLDKLDDTYKKSHNIAVSEVFHILMVAVNSDIKKQNLSSRLINTSSDYAINLGFKKVVAEATSSISQHIFVNKLSFKELYSINYSNFVFEDKHTFKGIKSTSSCKLIYKELALS